MHSIWKANVEIRWVIIFLIPCNGEGKCREIKEQVSLPQRFFEDDEDVMIRESERPPLDHRLLHTNTPDRRNGLIC